MIDQIHDSLPRRSSLSQMMNCDENGVTFQDVTRRSPLHIDEVSRGFDVRRSDSEQDVDGIRRDFVHSEGDTQIRDGYYINNRREEEEERGDRKHCHLRKDAFSGEHYPKSETKMKQCMSDERENSRFITYETVRLKEDGREKDTSSPISQVGSSGADHQEETSRLVSLNCRCCVCVNESERVDYCENHLVGYVGGSSSRGQQGKSCGDHYDVSKCGINKEIVDESQRSYQLGSDTGVKERTSVKDNVNTMTRETDLLVERRGYGSNVVDVDESERVYYNENRCASQVVQSRHFDGGNLSRDQQGKSFRDFSCGDHYDSPGVSKCGISKEIVDGSHRNYQLGCDTGVTELACVKHNVNTMTRETDPLVQRRGYGSNMVDVDAADTHLEFYTKERMADMKEHYPSVELGSSVVNERDDKAQYYRNPGYEERKVVSLENKGQQLLRKDYQYDGVDGRIYLDSSRQDVVVRDDKAPQSRTLCLNKEREAYLDNERKVVYSENRRRELRNEYYVGNDGRMHFDSHGEDIVVDRDGREVQLQRVSLNKGRAAYLDNEREEGYLQHKSQQLKKDYYDSGTDARIYPDVGWEDARGLRQRGVFLNDRKEDYLQCESQQFLNDHETDSYAIMHPDVYKSDIPVDREDARGLKYRRVLLNDGKEAYLQCESQQRLKDHEADPYAMMHPDVINKSNILVDARAPKLRQASQASFDDGKKLYLNNERGYAYLGYENQEVKNDHEYGIDGTMHPYVNKLDALVDQGDVRALELRGASYHDGNESYLDNEKGAAYLRYESQQPRKEYSYDIDDRIYRDVNRSDITLHHEDARLLERRGASFDNDNEAYKERENSYMHYKIQQSEKDYDSGIDARMYLDINRSEFVVDQETVRALERRGASLGDERKAYMHYENNQLLKDHEIGAYEMMHHDVRRSSAGKQGEEALRCRRYPFDDRNQVYFDAERLPLHNDGHAKVHANGRYPFDDRNQVYFDDERLPLRNDGHAKVHATGRYPFDDRNQVYFDDERLPPLRNDGHAKVHANGRYPDGRQKVYHSSEYGLREEAGEVVHENVADTYNKQSGMSYEKAYSGRFRDHEVPYDRENRVSYTVEGGTSTEQFRYLVDERSFRNDDHTSTPRRPRSRIPAKERLGGRVEDSRVDVKSRVTHQVRNPKRKGKSYNRNQKNIA